MKDSNQHAGNLATTGCPVVAEVLPERFQSKDWR